MGAGGIGTGADEEVLGVIGIGLSEVAVGAAAGIGTGAVPGVEPVRGEIVAVACAMRERMCARRSSRFGIREPCAVVSGWPEREVLAAGYPPYATPLHFVGGPEADWGP